MTWLVTTAIASCIAAGEAPNVVQSRRRASISSLVPFFKGMPLVLPLPNQPTSSNNARDDLSNSKQTKSIPPAVITVDTSGKDSNTVEGKSLASEEKNPRKQLSNPSKATIVSTAAFS